jgi:hypothetical protein
MIQHTEAEKLKKIYRLPVEIRRYKERWTRRDVIEAEIYPPYDERHIVVYENDLGLEPLPFKPEVLVIGADYINRYDMSDWKRRQWQKLSGKKAYIYALYSKVNNGVFYIGQATDTDRRYKQHSRILCRGIYFKMVLLCECPDEFKHEEEKRWLLSAKGKFKLKNIVYNSY